MAASSEVSRIIYEPSAIDSFYDNDLVNGQLFPYIPTSYTIKEEYYECFSCERKNRVVSVMNFGPKTGSKLALLYFHGNGSDLGDCKELLKLYSTWLNCIVFGIEYAGYGCCDGERSQSEIIYSCGESINYIFKYFKVPLNRMVLYGHSIGGALVLQLNDIFNQVFCGLILQSTFTNIKDIVSKKSSVTAMFISESFFSNLERIKKVASNQHVLIIHGEKDELIPKKCADDLFEACPLVSSQKKKFICKFSSHNAFDPNMLRYAFLVPFFRELETKCFISSKMALIQGICDPCRFFTPDQYEQLKIRYPKALREKRDIPWIGSDGKCQIRTRVPQVKKGESLDFALFDQYLK